MSVLHRQQGFVALLAVLLLGTIMLIGGLATSSIGQTQLRATISSYAELRARNFAAACLEEAVMRLKRNSSYGGAATVPIDDGTCSITVTGTGTSRTITVTATVEDHTKTTVAELQKRLVPGNAAMAWVIDSWQETLP